MKHLYIAGPMTGIPQFNYPAFEEAAKALRQKGYEVTSPHEQDSPSVQEAALASRTGALDPEGKVGGETYGQILAKDLIIVADKVDGICFLPNWDRSRGAKIEALVGLLTGKSFYSYIDGDIFEFPAVSVANQLRRAI